VVSHRSKSTYTSQRETDSQKDRGISQQGTPQPISLDSN
jgi:hypothetical protein